MLDGFDRIPVVDAYECSGELTYDFPFGEKLNAAKPHIVYKEGWKAPTSGCRKFSDLPKAAREYVDFPKAAREYVDFIEKQVDCEIKYVSVGAERDQIIVR